MIRKFLMVSLLVAAGVADASAQSDPIAERKLLMKTHADIWYGDINKMMKGETPYNPARVTEALNAIINSSKKAGPLFSDNAKTGGGTRALPTIWENRDDFNARLAKLGSDATAALAKVNDEAAFKAAQPGINNNCNQCHAAYRARGN